MIRQFTSIDKETQLMKTKFCGEKIRIPDFAQLILY